MFLSAGRSDAPLSPRSSSAEVSDDLLLPRSITAEHSDDPLLPRSSTAEVSEDSLSPRSSHAEDSDASLSSRSSTAEVSEDSLRPRSSVAERAESVLLPLSTASRRRAPFFMVRPSLHLFMLNIYLPQKPSPTGVPSMVMTSSGSRLLSVLPVGLPASRLFPCCSSTTRTVGFIYSFFILLLQFNV